MNNYDPYSDSIGHYSFTNTISRDPYSESIRHHSIKDQNSNEPVVVTIGLDSRSYRRMRNKYVMQCTVGAVVTYCTKLYLGREVEYRPVFSQEYFQSPAPQPYDKSPTLNIKNFVYRSCDYPGPVDHTRDTRWLWYFPRLPKELRLMVWEYAVPDTRTIPGAMVFITDGNLTSDRAIIPSPKELIEVYRIAQTENYNLSVYNDPSGSQAWGKYRYTDKEQVDFLVRRWSPVMDLLHFTQESRVSTRKIFRLDCPSRLPCEQDQWWKDDAKLYFPSFGNPYREAVTQLWLIHEPEDRHSIVSSIRHFELPLSLGTLEMFGISTQDVEHFIQSPDGPEYCEFAHGWLWNFPRLLSITFLHDPRKHTFMTEGKLVLYQPPGVPINLDEYEMEFGESLRPSQVEEIVTTRLRRAIGCVNTIKSGAFQGEVPLVECLGCRWNGRKKVEEPWRIAVSSISQVLHSVRQRFLTGVT